METASHDLMNEHKAILLALDVLESISRKVSMNGESDTKDIESMIDFLQVFADKCHHGKEEDFLFPAYEAVGIRKDNGPIGMMLTQHHQGREFIKQMSDSVSGKNFNKDNFIEAAGSYVDLMRVHINKENTVLFPMGDSMLSGPTQHRLLQDFENHEKNVIGEGKHEEYHAMLKNFQSKYLT